MGTLDENNKTLVQKYLTIIDSASLELAKDEQIQIISTLIERLKGMVEVLGKVYDPFKPVDAPGQPPAVSLLCPWYVK